MPELNTTLGNGRFLLQKKLGVGGMGSVYEALDHKRNVRVALKSLGQIDPLTVSSFKAEFRDFQHLHHPNLVVLDEFFNEGDEWYFTMELLTGSDLLTYVRRPSESARALELPTEHDSVRNASNAPRPIRVYRGKLALEALKCTLRQLTAALSHLHSAGKVHRDVKSSNVLIDDEGRVTLLDFGVAVDVKGTGVQLAGTPLYMAPELFWNTATPAADWYAVGVLLYQALTGSDPWQQQSGVGGLLTTKRAPPEHPADVDPSIPDELAELCMSLLIQNPRDRAGRRAILEWLDQNEDNSSADLGSMLLEEPESEAFIGRGSELRILRGHFDELASHEGPIVVFVQGESGIGKSALVEEFTRNLHITDRATLLRGRVLEEEVVPYKSVDGIIDALGEHFLNLGYQQVKPLLPEDFNIVAEVFPVLRRSPAVAELPRTKVTQPTERRLRMFVALKECLRRLGKSCPLVVTVDDLQWSDADSLQLWNELFAEPDPPRMLFLATLRLERTGSVQPSRRPPSIMPALLPSGMPTLPTPTRSIWLSRLSEDEARIYVEARLVGGSRSTIPDDIVHEASGHPLFIDELLRYRGTGIGTGQLTLDAVLGERIDLLDEDHRRYLALACISAKPLSRSMLSKAAGISHGQGLRALKALRAAHLVRTGRTPGADGDDWVDAFHYRVRNACVSRHDEDLLASLHRSIALTMEKEGKLDAEHLAIEWREAGERRKAGRYAEQAAAAAFAALAFQKAAEYYSDAVGLLADSDPAAKVRLFERYGRSLRNAGRAKAAADAFGKLAADLGDEAGFPYRNEAVELLLRSGHVDEALNAGRSLLASVGEHIPRGDRRALLSLAWGRARIGVTRHKWRPRPQSECSAEELRRLDALWSISFGLGSIEQLPSFALCARYAHAALSLGEPIRVAKAFAVEAMTSAAQGGEKAARVHAEEARRAAALVPDAAAEVAVVWSADALAQVMTGSWKPALEAARYAQQHIAQRCIGAVGEWSMAVEAELWALAGLGRYAELFRAATSLNQRGEKTEDLYAQIAAVSGLPNIGWLAQNQAEQALEVTSAISARWSQRGVHIQHLFDAYARGQAHLYRGEIDDAAHGFEDFERRAKGKLILVPHMMRVFRAELEGRIALARSFAGNPSSHQAVRRQIDQLHALKARWALGLAELLTAGLHHAEERPHDAAAAARAAAAKLGAANMSGYQQVALAYAERLLDPEAPAEADIRALGVVDPAAFTRLLAPGFVRFR